MTWKIGYLVLVRGVLTRASAAIDRGVVRLMERRMAPRTRQPNPPDPRDPRHEHDPRHASDPRVRLLELAAMYGDGTLGLPSRFFPSPAEPTVTLTPIGDGPLGTQVVDLRYPSDYEPFLPD